MIHVIHNQIEIILTKPHCHIFQCSVQVEFDQPASHAFQFLVNLIPHSVTNCHYHNNRSNTDDDAQHGQKRAHFIVEDGF